MLAALGVNLYMVMLTRVGSAGLVYGGAAGVIRSPHPVIHSLSCGIHWFACGTTFWCEFYFPSLLRRQLLKLAGLRSNILNMHYEDKATAKHRSYVSALSGGIAGGGVTKLMGMLLKR